MGIGAISAGAGAIAADAKASGGGLLGTLGSVGSGLLNYGIGRVSQAPLGQLLQKSGLLGDNPRLDGAAKKGEEPTDDLSAMLRRLGASRAGGQRISAQHNSVGGK